MSDSKKVDDIPEKQKQQQQQQQFIDKSVGYSDSFFRVHNSANSKGLPWVGSNEDPTNPNFCDPFDRQDPAEICYHCKQPEGDDILIQCDTDSLRIHGCRHWFHAKCIGIDGSPCDDPKCKWWICQDCANGQLTELKMKKKIGLEGVAAFFGGGRKTTGESSEEDDDDDDDSMEVSQEQADAEARNVQRGGKVVSEELLEALDKKASSQRAASKKAAKDLMARCPPPRVQVSRVSVDASVLPATSVRSKRKLPTQQSSQRKSARTTKNAVSYAHLDESSDDASEASFVPQQDDDDDDDDLSDGGSDFSAEEKKKAAKPSPKPAKNSRKKTTEQPSAAEKETAEESKEDTAEESQKDAAEETVAEKPKKAKKPPKLNKNGTKVWGMRPAHAPPATAIQQQDAKVKIKIRALGASGLKTLNDMSLPVSRSGQYNPNNPVHKRLAEIQKDWPWNIHFQAAYVEQAPNKRNVSRDTDLRWLEKPELRIFVHSKIAADYLETILAPMNEVENLRLRVFSKHDAHNKTFQFGFNDAEETDDEDDNEAPTSQESKQNRALIDYYTSEIARLKAIEAANTKEDEDSDSDSEKKPKAKKSGGTKAAAKKK